MSDEWNQVFKSEEVLKLQAETEQLLKEASGNMEADEPLSERISDWSEAYKKSCKL